MPHDRDGKLIEIGDFVYIPCVVTEIQPNDNFCTLSLNSEATITISEGIPLLESKGQFTLNAKHVIRKS